MATPSPNEEPFDSNCRTIVDCQAQKDERGREEGAGKAGMMGPATGGETAMQSSDKIAFAERPTCTIRQAAEATGLSRSSLYQRIADDQLLTHKIGRRRLVNVKSLLALVGADPRPPT